MLRNSCALRSALRRSKPRSAASTGRCTAKTSSPPSNTTATSIRFEITALSHRLGRRGKEIIFALHFDQTRRCPGKRRRIVSFDIQQFWPHRRRTDQLHPAVIKGVDQQSEAACLIALFSSHLGNIVDQNRMKTLRKRKIISRSQRRAAERIKRNPRHAARRLPYGQRPR